MSSALRLGYLRTALIYIKLKILAWIANLLAHSRIISELVLMFLLKFFRITNGILNSQLIRSSVLIVFKSDCLVRHRKFLDFLTWVSVE